MMKTPVSSLQGDLCVNSFTWNTMFWVPLAWMVQASDNRAFYLPFSGSDTQVKREVNVRLKFLAFYSLLLVDQSQRAPGYKV